VTGNREASDSFLANRYRSPRCLLGSFCPTFPKSLVDYDYEIGLFSRFVQQIDHLAHLVCNLRGQYCRAVMSGKDSQLKRHCYDDRESGSYDHQEVVDPSDSRNWSSVKISQFIETRRNKLRCTSSTSSSASMQRQEVGHVRLVKWMLSTQTRSRDSC